MEETKFESIADGIGSILGGAAPVISAITGKQPGPQSVTYVTTAPQNNNFMLFGGIAVVVVLIIILIKK